MFPSGEVINLEYMCGESSVLVTSNVCKNFNCFISLNFCRLFTSVQQ